MHSKVKTLPGKKPIKHKVRRKYKQLIFTVVGVYLLAGALLGMFLFNGINNGGAKADQFASISTSIRFTEEKQLQLGDQVSILATLQNTSVNESINNISIDLLSTQDGIQWKEATNLSAVKPIEINNNVLSLPVLSAGERVQYQISGVLKDSTIDFLTVLAKINYNNIVGKQQIDTNRIYTQLNPKFKQAQDILKLTANKPILNKGEVLELNLGLQEGVEMSEKYLNMKGKIYITNRETSEVAYTFDCISEKENLCKVSTADLNAGKYSSMFINDNDNIFSQIPWFEISGENQKLTPNTQASLLTPFGTNTINGQAPIIIEKVITKNDSLNVPPCEFLIYNKNVLINRVEAKVDNDRSCRAIISSSQVGDKSGVYTIKLNNSDKEAVISIVPESKALFELKNLSLSPKKGQDIEISAENLVDKEGKKLEDINYSINIYHQNTGKITKLQDEEYKVKEGKLSNKLDGKDFEQSGLYMIWLELANEQSSRFLNLAFFDSELGFSKSGILVDNTKIDKDTKFTIQGITDRDGNIITEGFCAANIFGLNTGLNPVVINGKVGQGECNLVLNQGQITKSGPILVSLKTDNGSSSLNQSRSLNLQSGTAVNFGDINLEFSPARKNYANNLILGPVVDKFNNLTESFNHKVVILDSKDNIVQEIKNVNIIEGFAKLVLPSSTFQDKNLTLRLLNNEDGVILEKKITVVENTNKLILPSLPSELPVDGPVDVGIANVEIPEETEKCTVQFIKSSEEFIEEQFAYQDKKCEFKWNINKFRDTKKALLKLQIKDYTFSKILDLKTGEASNLFQVAPQVKLTTNNELEINLLTTPLVDRHGQVATSGEIKWEYNGKIRKTNIENGFSQLNILAKDIENKDISNNFDKRFLDLDLDVSATVASISKTNNLNMFLGDYDIANDIRNFSLKQGSNYTRENKAEIFAFKTNTCKAEILNSNKTNITAKTHFQANTCYVEILGTTGKNSLTFEDNGYDLGKFEFLAGETPEYVDWCKDTDQKCSLIQVLAPTTSKIEAIIYDGENQYKFYGEELSNIVKVSQNGLNPLKNYLVEINYHNLENQKISHYKEILGEKLSQ